MDKKNKQQLEREIADLTKSVLSGIYTKFDILDVGAKLHPVRQTPNKEVRTGFFMFDNPTSPEGFITFLIKTDIPDNDKFKLFGKYDMDIPYLKDVIIPDEVLWHFYDNGHPIIDSVILTDSSGKQIARD
jgi:hypothetical protein